MFSITWICMDSYLFLLDGILFSTFWCQSTLKCPHLKIASPRSLLNNTIFKVMMVILLLTHKTFFKKQPTVQKSGLAPSL